MRIFFLSAGDDVFLPRFYDKVFAESKHDICGVAVVDDPHFKRFLLASLKFMGWRLFFSEVFHQVILKIKNMLYKIFMSSKITSIENICQKYNVDFLTAKKINTKAFRNFLQTIQVDVLVSVACPQILKKKILEIPSKAAINVHYALLPRYRGQYPSFWVLAKGEEYTGVSVHYMAEKIDAGEILVQIKEKIETDDTFYSLVGRLKTTIGPDALLQALGKIADGDMTGLPNDIDSGSYFSFPTREDMIGFLQRGRKWR